ncbi:MAG: hypothetical protein ACRCV9_13520 [Burkholderiaceae bacterium]
MTIILVEDEVIRSDPLPALPCSKRTEPSEWLCPPPGGKRRDDLGAMLKDVPPILLSQSQQR